MASHPMASDSAEHPSAGRRSPEAVDRLMIGACSAIWLALLAVSVVALVALVRMAGGRTAGGHSWLLYSIVVISALVIIGAIPLLLRARRAARAADWADSDTDWPEDPADHLRYSLPPAAATERGRVFGVDPYARRHHEPEPAALIAPEVLDRLWLRGTTSLLGAIGLALTSVATATYLLANSWDTGAWIALGLAGVITVAMPAILTFYQRRIADAEDEAGY